MGVVSPKLCQSPSESSGSFSPLRPHAPEFRFRRITRWRKVAVMCHDKAERCPKCAGSMELGFIVDKDHGGQTVSKWSPGTPVKSFWQGTKIDRELIIPVGTYRCSTCGFLEAFARPEFAAR